MSSTRLTRRDFYYNHFPEKTCAELTKVNKVPLMYSLSVNCKGEISLTVKPEYQPVNKIGPFSTYYLNLSTNYQLHFIILTYYPINLLTSLSNLWKTMKQPPLLFSLFCKTLFG